MIQEDITMINIYRHTLGWRIPPVFLFSAFLKQIKTFWIRIVMALLFKRKIENPAEKIKN